MGRVNNWFFVFSFGLIFLFQPCYGKDNRRQEVVVYAVVEDYARNAGLAFRKKTGIKVNVVSMVGSGATLARIQKEKTTADVWFGGSIGAHAQGAYEGLIQPYRPRGYSQLAPQFRDPLGNSLVNGLYTGVIGFVVNLETLKKNNLSPPRSWKDLLDERYRGMITMKSPLTSGTAYTTLITVITLMGENHAFDYLRKLNRNIAYTRNQMIGVTDDEKCIAITFIHEAMSMKKKYSFVDVIIPQEGTGFEIGGLSLIKNGPNPVAAREFIDFTLSLEGQQILVEGQGDYQFPVHLKANSKPEVQAYRHIPLLDMNFQWAGIHRQRLLERWQKEVLLPKG